MSYVSSSDRKDVNRRPPIPSLLDPESFVSAVTAAAARSEKQRRHGATMNDLNDADSAFLDVAIAGTEVGLKVHSWAHALS